MLIIHLYILIQLYIYEDNYTPACPQHQKILFIQETVTISTLTRNISWNGIPCMYQATHTRTITRYNYCYMKTCFPART